jgi:hypothetical protein
MATDQSKTEHVQKLRIRPTEEMREGLFAGSDPPTCVPGSIRTRRHLHFREHLTYRHRCPTRYPIAVGSTVLVLDLLQDSIDPMAVGVIVHIIPVLLDHVG